MTDDEYRYLLDLRKPLAARAQELYAKGNYFQSSIWRAKATGVAMVIRKFPSESKMVFIVLSVIAIYGAMMFAVDSY